MSGFKYYLVILDDFSHYVWTFPLRFKSDTFATLSQFFAFVKTQFAATIRSIQCDNGREFDNSNARTFFLTNGVSLQMSCPHTSPQNGKAERMLRSLNNIVRSLLFQAGLPPSFWVEALHTATHLINRHLTKTLHHHTPFFALYGAHPSYTHLRVFGCKCYPNLSASTAHKLAPRSVMCVFLGYLENHKGYRCFDPISNRVYISRHVVFDEHSFPFAEMTNSADASNLDFLDDFSAPLPTPIGRRAASDNRPPMTTSDRSLPASSARPDESSSAGPSGPASPVGAGLDTSSPLSPGRAPSLGSAHSPAHSSTGLLRWPTNVGTTSLAGSALRPPPTGAPTQHARARRSSTATPTRRLIVRQRSCDDHARQGWHLSPG